MTNTPTIVYQGDGKITIKKTVIEETRDINVLDHYQSIIEQHQKIENVYADIANTKVVLEQQIDDIKAIIEEYKLDPEKLQEIYDNIVSDISSGLAMNTIKSKYEIEDIKAVAFQYQDVIDDKLNEDELITIIKTGIERQTPEPQEEVVE